MRAGYDRGMAPKVVYFDVDDTLVRSAGSKRIPITSMVSLVRQLRDHGAVCYLWSTGGADYAREAARELGIDDCFVAFLPKPHALVDDISIADWKFLEFHPNEAGSLTAQELLDRIP